MENRKVSQQVCKETALFRETVAKEAETFPRRENL